MQFCVCVVYYYKIHWIFFVSFLEGGELIQYAYHKLLGWKLLLIHMLLSALHGLSGCNTHISQGAHVLKVFQPNARSLQKKR